MEIARPDNEGPDVRTRKYRTVFWRTILHRWKMKAQTKPLHNVKTKKYYSQRIGIKFSRVQYNEKVSVSSHTNLNQIDCAFQYTD